MGLNKRIFTKIQLSEFLCFDFLLLRYWLVIEVNLHMCCSSLFWMHLEVGELVINVCQGGHLLYVVVADEGEDGEDLRSFHFFIDLN